MRAEEIYSLLRAQPFMPFRIHVSDGATYEVPEPLFVLVTRRRVEIGLNADEGGLPAEAVFVDPLHITRVTFVNGKGSRGKRRVRRK
jgi:hypothetical protein